jgi:DNA-binding PadR family transcriptional regulator
MEVRVTRRRVSNPLALAVLGCLSERPMHPYEMSTTLRSRGKEQSIKLNYGSLYAVVESLQKHGLIAVRETTREGRRPERTVYEITPAGQDEFEDWLAELLSTPVHDFTSLEAGLSLMPGLPPDEVARLLTERADHLRIELRGLEAMFVETAEMGLPELVLVESRYRERMLAAELEFVTSLAQAIRDETFPGAKAWRRLHELRGEGVSFQEILSDPVAHLGEEARGLAPQPPDDVRQ